MSFPQALKYTIRAVLNFYENSQSYSQLKVHHGVIDTGGKWKKSSIIKVLIILFGHLWEVELIYRYIFAFIATNINSTSETGGKICRRCR
jgi:hypothetical protein